MEFVDDQAVSVIVRTAVMVPRNCQQQDIVRMVSLFESFSQNQIAWKFPELSSSDQAFRTWSGMGLKVDIYADNEHNMAEETSLFQVCSLSNRRDVLHQFDLNSRQTMHSALTKLHQKHVSRRFPEVCRRPSSRTELTCL